MKLISFSVTNYRSITTAHKINLQSLTVLVGKNNEGKSNLLTALNASMTLLMFHSRIPGNQGAFRPFCTRDIYEWERDFPVQLKNRKSGLESIFRMEFRLESDELLEFHNLTGIRGNEDIPIVVKIGKANSPKIEVPKRGSSSYNKKSAQIASFISQRISFNYIKAVRTENMAFNGLQDVIYDELRTLANNTEYNEALSKINSLQQDILNNISEKLYAPLKVFLPQLKSVKITKEYENNITRLLRNDIDVIIDDGIPTSISYKGDGIKSLVALAILKDRRSDVPASIIAIEEPESHLHSGAIHELVEVINEISKNNQVIITTHNPLFVQQNSVKSNVIVNNGTAQSAKSIEEIRSILGVLPSDNLRNARYVLVVEGEDDKLSLARILPVVSETVGLALKSNKLIIKPLFGASNLAHDLLDLRNSLCQYVALLDNDNAGLLAIEKAINAGLLSEANYKVTSCPGSPESEFEDCINKTVYEDILNSKFGININVPEFRNNKKWSDRIRDVRTRQGGRWTDTIEKNIKMAVAESIPEIIENIDDVLIKEKSGFIYGLASLLERMLSSDIS
ncbi:MAG: AAA family ATPase [Clostridia bacterium]|nr:AAA family ATPase [Clostridia bacterium]